MVGIVASKAAPMLAGAAVKKLIDSHGADDKKTEQKQPGGFDPAPADSAAKDPSVKQAARELVGATGNALQGKLNALLDVPKNVAGSVAQGVTDLANQVPGAEAAKQFETKIGDKVGEEKQKVTDTVAAVTGAGAEMKGGALDMVGAITGGTVGGS